MGDAGEDEAGAEPPDQAQQFENGAADPRCAEFVNGSGGRQGLGLALQASDKSEMDLILYGIERSCEGLDYALGSAATQMRNEQEDPRWVRQRHSLAKVQR